MWRQTIKWKAQVCRARAEVMTATMTMMMAANNCADTQGEKRAAEYMLFMSMHTNVQTILMKKRLAELQSICNAVAKHSATCKHN